MRNKDGGDSLGLDINLIVIKIMPSISPFLLDKLALISPLTVMHEVAFILKDSLLSVGISGLKRGQGLGGWLCHKYN